jgi:hypothetical protein
VTDYQHDVPDHTFGPADQDVLSMVEPHAHPVFEPNPLTTSPFESGQNPAADGDDGGPASGTGFRAPARRPANLPRSPHFGTGGYHGEYNGLPGCWFSSDGYVYDPSGNRVGIA